MLDTYLIPRRRLIFVQLTIIRTLLAFFNFMLSCCRFFLFGFRPRNPPIRVLVYKVGNIGDIVCAIPALTAVRRQFPRAYILLLTSAGAPGAIGAREVLAGAKYIDEIITYSNDDINTWAKQIHFLRRIRALQVNFFIQLPDDRAHFFTLMRNLVFAKLIGARWACGFIMRYMPLWKNAQVDHFFTNTEIESLVWILKRERIADGKIVCTLPITESDHAAAQSLLFEKWSSSIPSMLIAMSPSCKRETNRWPIDRFSEISSLLHEKYHAGIVVVGGVNDRSLSDVLADRIPEEYFLDATGKLTLMQSTALLARCTLLVANSTGTTHLAAAVGTPCLGFYSVRDILGRWFPYGVKHRALYHRGHTCDYRREECIDKSIRAVSTQDAYHAATQMLDQICEQSSRAAVSA